MYKLLAEYVLLLVDGLQQLYAVEALLLSCLTHGNGIAKQLIDGLCTKFHFHHTLGIDVLAQCHGLIVKVELSSEAVGLTSCLLALQSVVEEKGQPFDIDALSLGLQLSQVVFSGVECSYVPAHGESDSCE